MSRVYYDAAEKPEEVTLGEVWAELADGSCRWRQTGSEIKIVALKVPPELPPRELAVEFQPYSLRVANRKTGKVYLEGELERGIVPEECVWMHSGGINEDGCVLLLQKMNLELLQRQWAHSQMWWPKLFTHHGEIAWDDYEKDYSDLPEVVLRKHRTVEAKRDEVRKLEQAEKGVRESLQERDDARKRQRQERLHFLRTELAFPLRFFF
ncbi:hypothetical protein H632_c2095p1 [Helicosporidium sp. ATCC 50920]|nr:hypothetical protein H632_c2095p1 [Helicosporidium sp. ATCC 50920]|eukprot:KDD73520.1 hypothetical protein H632_c2095p1 [Helicosporidium sp. ATCC 50920]